MSESEGLNDCLAACREWVRKVECGEARSIRSYAQMKAAIAKVEQEQAAPVKTALSTHDVIHLYDTARAGRKS